jgi:hypothetical protein
LSTSSSSAALFLIGFAWFGLQGWRHASAVPATGDEPDYLLIAQSLWSDSDLNTDDNFARGDFEAYAPGLSRAPGMVRRPDGGGAPVHSAGLPALIAPVFAFGGRGACVALMALLGAWLALEIHGLSLRMTGDGKAASLAWASMLGLPTLGMAITIYPEVPAALAIALALRWIKPLATPLQSFAAAASISALPWLHARVAGAAVALGALALSRLRGRSLVTFGGTALVAALSYFAFFRAAYGVATPWQVYRGAMSRGTPELAVSGLLFDPSYGLLPYAPVFLIALAGLPLLLRRRNADRWAHAALLLSLIVPVLMFRKWWGGYCPPARFLVPIMPLLGPALAVRVASRTDGEDGRPYGVGRWAKALLAASIAVAILPAAFPADKLLLNGRDENPRLWDKTPGGALLSAALPKVSSRAGTLAPPWIPPASEVRIGIAWLVAVALLLGLDAMSRARPTLARRFGAAALSIVVVLTLVAGSVRRTAPDPPNAVLPAEEESQVQD